MNQESALPDAQPYRWVIVILTVLTFLLTFVARFTWPPLISSVVPILNMKMSQAGAYMSAFYIGYVITQIPAGILADKIGVRLILTGSLILTGLATFGMGFIRTYEVGFALRIGTGLGAGAVYSACARALMEWIPPRERGFAFGAFMAAPSAGILLSGWLIPPLESAFGWEGAFKTVGISAICVGVLVFFLVRASDQAQSKQKIMDGFKVVLGNKDLVLTAMAGFCLMWLELGTATWTFAHVEHLGHSRAAAGGILVAYGIGGMISPFLSGILSDKIGHRKSIFIGSLVLAIPATLIFGYQTSLTMLTIFGFIFGFCSYLSNPHLTVMISEFAGKNWAATANGASNFIFQMASIIGPFLVGLSIDATGMFKMAWWIMAAGPLAGILLLLPVNMTNTRD